MAHLRDMTSWPRGKEVGPPTRRPPRHRSRGYLNKPLDRKFARYGCRAATVKIDAKWQRLRMAAAMRGTKE